ncbi:MAG: flagellar motor switch protein FliG [Beijerinckiaceae bacterium]
MSAAATARHLRGPEKVAALLLAMDKSVASSVLRRFDRSEIRQITLAASSLGRLSANVFADLVEEFATLFSAGADLQGSPVDAERLLESALEPDVVSDIMSDILGKKTNNLWKTIDSLPPEVLSGFLEKEHPQAIAFFLSKCSAPAAATVLALFDENMRKQVAVRLVAPRQPSERILHAFEAVMQEELMAADRKGKGANPHQRVASILNKMSREQSDAIIAKIAESDAGAAAAIRELMFGFEDIPKLSSQARLVVFENIPPEKLILALKGMPSDFAEIALSALGARARRMVEQELASGQTPPSRDVEAARRSIADTVLSLAEMGAIELTSDESE